MIDQNKLDKRLEFLLVKRVSDDGVDINLARNNL